MSTGAPQQSNSSKKESLCSRPSRGAQEGTRRFGRPWKSNGETERVLDEPSEPTGWGLLAWLSSVQLLQRDVNTENVGYFPPALVNL